MSSNVAVAGGSQGLGRAIVDALKESGKYTTLVLSRKADPELEKKLGVRVVPVDYSNIDALVKTFEDNQIDTVINTFGVLRDSTPLFNVLKAADKSKSTKRYIPSLWSGMLYGPEDGVGNPVVEDKMHQMELLAKTSLQWTAIYNGLFLEFLAPGIPTYANTTPLFVDVANNAAAIPGSGDYPVHFTWTKDIGKYITALLGLEKWENKYLITGDTKTFDEIIAIGEKIKGAKFDVKYDSKEKLEKGEFTELPGYAPAYERAMGPEVGRAMMSQMLPWFGSLYVKGTATYPPSAGTFLNEVFPDIKAMSIEEALKMSFQK